MKLNFWLFTALTFTSCLNSNKSDPNTELNIPDIMLRNNLGNQYLQTKWEMYKYNMKDTLYFDSLKAKVPFLQCDLKLIDKDSFYINYVGNDTVKTLGLEPVYKGDYKSDFYSGKPQTYYGASFKGDSLKYIPVDDGAFVILDSNISLQQNRDSFFIKYIDKNREKVNRWLIEYAIFKGFIKE